MSDIFRSLKNSHLIVMVIMNTNDAIVFQILLISLRVKYFKSRFKIFIIKCFNSYEYKFICQNVIDLSDLRVKYKLYLRLTGAF